jgi:hypothetical protein
VPDVIFVTRWTKWKNKEKRIKFLPICNRFSSIITMQDPTSARKPVNIDCYDFTVLCHQQYNPKLGSSLPKHEGHLAGHPALPNNDVKRVTVPWNYMNIVRNVWITDVNWFGSLENNMFLLCSPNIFFHFFSPFHRAFWFIKFYSHHVHELVWIKLNIFSLLCFVIMNRDQYKLNSNIHGRNTRQISNFHLAISNLTLYQRGKT